MTKSYLFFAEKDELTILSIKFKGDQEFQMEFLKYLGEKTFPLPMNFWDWWKKAVSYTLDDCVDFCFVCDKEYEFTKDEFLSKVEKPEETNWDLDILKSFFHEYTSYQKIGLQGEDGDEIELCLPEKSSADKKGKFFTSLCGIAEEYAVTLEEEPAEVTEVEAENSVSASEHLAQEREDSVKKQEKRRMSGKTTDFARYFKDLLEAERD